ncbi:hypothetical protein J2Z44_003518 [Clostridium punense]|uniref:Uncharacterized protein n=1 Tax=Clostridium punense TaxID=1054297 RepID=A0ABS4K8V5_9CLOT|nr:MULTISPECIES: aspartyl-phosphate phosphatase Spo0E family protein [Clostridium]EQB87239.1 hypothetical protein M918_10310 [Clostridium sp. BL8]MBP2023676.1 hypothetical protein [Clostridium punense]
MDEIIEILRDKLYRAIENGNSEEILKASMDLDIEIVRVMIADSYVARNYRNKNVNYAGRMWK